MSEKEMELFLAFLRNSKRYVEFGTGGSTVLASQHVGHSIISVDSSREWQDKVAASCEESAIKPHLIHVDIGPVGEWGYPLDASMRHNWPAYHETIWDTEGSRYGDLFLIDGRFRVACFAQTVIRCRKNALICIHDFTSRKHYHVMHEIAREIATAEDMSIFQARSGIDDVADRILQEYKWTTE